MESLVLPVIMVAFIAMLYFTAIRPQKRRQQELQRILGALKAGDEVVTVGGIYGTVTELEEGGTLLVEVAESTEIRIARSAVAGLAGQVVPAPGTPVVADAAPEPDRA